MNDLLKPCPFCGAINIFIFISPTASFTRISCSTCPAEIKILSNGKNSTSRDAKLAWNRRDF